MKSRIIFLVILLLGFARGLYEYEWEMFKVGNSSFVSIIVIVVRLN